jgi:hypothetical protein
MEITSARGRLRVLIYGNGSVARVSSLAGLDLPYRFPGTDVPGFHMPPLRGWGAVRSTSCFTVELQAESGGAALLLCAGPLAPCARLNTTAPSDPPCAPIRRYRRASTVPFQIPAGEASSPRSASAFHDDTSQ